jgi:hypothetical protein
MFIMQEEAEQSLSHGDSAGSTMTDGIDRTKLQNFINMTILKVVVGKIGKLLFHFVFDVPRFFFFFSHSNIAL